MLLQRIACAVALMFGAVGFASAQKDVTPEVELYVKGDIQIGPDGHVTDWGLKTQMAPTIAELVDRTVRGWHFEPVTLDGKPVNAKTTMDIRLRGTPAPNDAYSLRIEDVHFGALTHASQKPPQYPRDAAHLGLGARVVLYLLIDENGKVIEALPGQTSLSLQAKDEHEAEFWRKRFEKASLAAATTWRYNPSEFIDGKGVTKRYAIAPIEFDIGHSGQNWKTYLPGPVHPAPWQKNDASKNETRFAQLSNGETASANSSFRLKDDVIGKGL
jgi:hypothetical protein